MNFRKSSTRRRGFTILELMVAMTITAIIVGVLVSITGTAIDTWNRSRNELRAARQAEACINAMSKDLESLVLRGDRPGEWLVAVTDVPSGGSTNAAKFIFYSAATDRYDGQVGVQEWDFGGDISCVAYQLNWRDPVSESGQQFETYVLNRLVVSPKMGYPVADGATPDPQNDLEPGAFDMLGNVNLLTAFDNIDADLGASENLSAQRNFLCENIFQFTLVFHVDVMEADGSTATRMISVNPGANGKTSFRIQHNAIQTEPAQAEIANGVLTAVEVSITVLTDAAINQLRANETLAENSDWLSTNSYNFTRLVQVPRK